MPSSVPETIRPVNASVKKGNDLLHSCNERRLFVPILHRFVPFSIQPWNELLYFVPCLKPFVPLLVRNRNEKCCFVAILNHQWNELMRFVPIPF